MFLHFWAADAVFWELAEVEKIWCKYEFTSKWKDMWRKSQTIVMEADEPMIWIKLMIKDITLFYQYHDKPNETLTL